jgi:hypothetical protein
MSEKILGWVKAAQERVSYLAEQEKQALIDIDALPIGSHIGAAHWNFIKELGYRKNELQDLLKNVEAPAASPVMGLDEQEKKNSIWKWIEEVSTEGTYSGDAMRKLFNKIYNDSN